MTDQLADVNDGADVPPVDHGEDAEIDGIDANASTAADDDTDSPVTGRPRRSSRPSRWDRPPEPRDWRFYVGTLGRILIATGLLMLGFVAYQLWGTGIETARTQNRLESEFEQLLADFDVESSPDVAAEPDTAPASPASEPTDTDDDVGDAEPLPSVADDAITPPTDAAEIPVAVDLSDDAVVQAPIPQPFRGDPLLRLEIPKIGRDDIVVPGVRLNDLKDGPGHYPDTPLPGQLGNASIAGHRTTYGAPFFDVDDLSAGDEIITTLLNGDRFVYEVTFVEVVAASDYWVVATSNPDIAELTLTSCHPKYTARDRIVVHSVLNPDKSSNVGFPTFYSLEPDPEDAPIPGDDPVLTAPPEVATEGGTVVADPIDDVITDDETTDEASVEPATPAPDTVDAIDETETGDESTSAGAIARPAAPGSSPEPIDAFDQGWFDDPAAFPQITLWAAALALVCAAAYQVAKRARRWSVGLAVGAVPFLVALYFFYQNVNRLLPPGI